MEKSGGAEIGDLSDAQSVKGRLYILQHGSAVSKNDDPDRPLSAGGRDDVERLAERLAELVATVGSSGERNIGQILHSGKLRAEQTARIIADGLMPAVNPELCAGVSPNDNAIEFIENQQLIHSMRQETGRGDLMIVSHMPFVSNLCSTLLTSSTKVKFDFTPATLVCLFYEYEEWSMEFMARPEIY